MYSPTSSNHDPELHLSWSWQTRLLPVFISQTSLSLLVPHGFPHCLSTSCVKSYGQCSGQTSWAVCVCLSSSYQGKIPHESQCLGAWGCFQKSLGSLINFLFLIRWPVLNTRNSVTMLGWTLILIYNFLTHSSSSFYVFYLLLHCSFVKTNICHEDITANLD